MPGPHTKIRRYNKVNTELSDELRSQVDRLLIENSTYEQISQFLKAKGHDISHSCVGRYGREFLIRYKRLRMIEDQARTLLSDAGSGMALEEAISKVFSQQILETLFGAAMDPQNLTRLASAFSSLQSSSVNREKYKMDIKKRADKIFDNAEKNLKHLTKEELIKTLRADVYGLV